MRRQQGNSLLREAICEFRFHPDSAWDLTHPGLIFNELKGRFPRRVQQGHSIPHGAPSLPPEFSLSHQQDLMLWKEEDDNGVIIIGPNRLRISHYRPHPTWDSFLSIIQEAYEAYVRVVRPLSLRRVGLRHINEVTIGSNQIDLMDYFNYYPYLGSNLPKDYYSTRMMVDLPYRHERDRARLSLSVRPSRSRPTIVRLDIDYSVLVAGSVGIGDTADWLNEAHSTIEELLEGCLTDTTWAILERGE